MDTITITGNYDGHIYVVVALLWIVKEQIREAHTESNPTAGTFKFDSAGFSRTMLKTCVLKNGKPLTDEDIAAWDAHTGDVVNRAVSILNSLTAEENRSLKRQPTWTIQKIP